MKKTYNAPMTSVQAVETETIIAASQFDNTKDTQEITVTDAEYEGEFQSKQQTNAVEWNSWDE